MYRPEGKLLQRRVKDGNLAPRDAMTDEAAEGLEVREVKLIVTNL